MRRAPVLAAVLALVLTACAPPAAETPAPTPPTPSPTVEPPPAPTPTPNTSPVYTDYSQLGDRPAPLPDIYDRWHGEFTDRLIPSPDYGLLIPFGGNPVADEWGYGGYALDGLMTLDGKVVVDPVYSSVVRLGWGGDYDMGTLDGYFPAFLLSRYAGDGKGDLFGGHDDVLSRLCAADGSWVTEREYRFGYETLCYGRIGENGALFALRDGNVLVLLDPATGKETFAVTLDGMSEDDLSDVLYNAAYGDGRVTACTTYYDNGRVSTSGFFCWDLEGNAISLPADVSELSGGFSEGLCPAKQSTSGLWGYLDVDGAWAIPPQFNAVWSFEDGVARVRPADRSVDTLFIDKTGQPLHSGVAVYDHVERSGDYWYFSGYAGDVGLVLDSKGSEVNSPLLHGGRVDVMDHGWAVMGQPDGSQLLARGSEGWTIPAGWDGLWYGSVTEDAVCLNYYGFSVEYAPGDSRPRWLMWRPEDGAVPSLYDPRVRLGSCDSPRVDPVTGEKYFVIWNDDGACSILTPDGGTLFENLPDWGSLYGGRCLYTETVGTAQRLTLLSPEGEVLFRRTLANTDD